MRKTRTFPSILTATFLFLSALLCPLVLSCSGNGSASNMDGDIYTPGAGASGSGSGAAGGSGTSSGTATTGGITAADILDMANSGNTDGIVAVFKPTTASGGSDSAQEQTIVLDADAIGLPAGGTVTLTITGRGVDYNVSASADADGNVTFTVPAIVTGTEVTVTLVVKAANGAVMYAGNTTQVLSGDEFQMNLSLTRQYWVMPSSISVTATPNTLAYDPVTLDSDSVTFNIQGLADAPAGVEYSWTDGDGSVVGTGATLTRTVNQILGADFVPTQDEETRTYSVAVSYTDATGESKSLTASAEVTVVTTATIVLTGGDILTEDGRQLLVLKTAPAGTAPAMTNLSASVICYGGTATFGWSLPGSGEATLSGTTGDTNSVTPQAGGMATLTVTATLDDGRTLTKELDIYVLQVDMTGTSPAGHDLSENSSSPTIIAEDEDAVMNMTASLVGITDLAGAEFEWVGVGAEVTTLTLTPSGAGNTACALVPKEAQEDGITLKAKITWRGVLVQAERYIKVVGLRLGLPEDIDGLLLNHAPTATNQLTFELTPVGFALTDGLNSPSWAPMSGSIATVAPGTAGTSIVVTAATGPDGGFTYETGVVEVTFSAYLGADAIPLTAKRKVTVMDFIIKDSLGTALPAMNSLTWPATKDIVAELKGPPADATVTYSWENGTPAAVSLISPSPAGTATVKLASASASGSSVITVTARYGGNDYPKTVTFAAGYIVDVSSMTTMELDTYLTNLLSGLDATVYTKDNPAKITLTGLPEAEWSSSDSGVYNTALGKMKTVADAIRSSGAYLDLSETQLPDGTPLYSNRYDTTGNTSPSTSPARERGLFYGCTKLVKAPQLPVNNTTALNKERSLDYAFSGCTNLTEIPEIPAWVNDLYGTFENCTSLEDLHTVTIPCPTSNMLQYTFNGCTGLKYPPAIANGVTQLPNTFGSCTSLLVAPNIPNSVQQMGMTFERCTSLTVAPDIPDAVINLDSCFIGCTSLTEPPPNIPHTVTDMDSCFNGCKELTRAPVIPASVTSIERCFAGCQSLVGNVVIKASFNEPAKWLKTFGTPNAWYLTPLGLGKPSGMTVYVPAAGTDSDGNGIDDAVDTVLSDTEHNHLSAGTYGTDAGTPCKVIAVDTTAGQTWPTP